MTKVLRTGPAPEFSPTRPDVRRVRLSTCRPCGIQMSTAGDGRGHEGHDEQHRQGYGLRREDSPPGPVHRVTARCSKAVSASRQRPYQTQAAQAAAAPASNTADSVRALSPRERLLFIGQSFPRSWGRTIGRIQSPLCDPTAGGSGRSKRSPGPGRGQGFLRRHSGVAASAVRIGRPWRSNWLPH